MEVKRRNLARIWFVIEVLFLAFVLFAFVDTVILAIRMGRSVNFQFAVTALATIVPGVLLTRGYLSYAQGREEGRSTILACAAATAVIFGLSLVPRLNMLLFGVSELPGFQTLYIRQFDLLFGLRGSGRIFLLDLIVQAGLPLLLLALCEGKSFVGNGAPRDMGSALLRVAGSVFAVWAAYMVTDWLIRSDTFGHSWIIVGFIPIPGQIMLALPAIVALGAIITLWTKR
ncbi:MAG: hypothetical protein IKG18_00540 [Atopobiaceae bacterium]|nr:hypothetical protein [Atopobiaceae bacterium]